MLVAKFGVRKFLSGKELAHSEMRAAARYYQCLVSIERWRRDEYRAIRSAAVPGLGEIDIAYQQLDEWIGEHAGPKGKRGSVREKRRKASVKAPGVIVPTKKVEADDELDMIAELKIWRKEAGALAKPLRAQFAAAVDPAIAEHARRAAALRLEWGAVDGDNHAKRRSLITARESMLLEAEWSEPWRRLAALETLTDELKTWVKSARLMSVGTYYAIQQRDFPAACKRPKPRPDGEPHRPKERPSYSRRRFRRIGWEIKGCTWGDVIDGKSGDLRIANLRNVGGTNGGRVKQRATASIRLRQEDSQRWAASDLEFYPAHDGEWRVEVEIAIHRPIPLDTKVKWVYLVPEERSLGRWEYSVQFTLEPTAPLIQRAPGQGVANVDLCWTQDGETLIVAKVNGEPLRLPLGGPRRGVVPSLRHAEYLRSVADKYFDAARDETNARIVGFPTSAAKACAGIAQWRGHGKLRRVSDILVESLGLQERATWERWKSLRLPTRDLFELDVARFAAELGLTDPRTLFAFWLAHWARKDRHLEAMAAGARYHGMGRRTDFYRVTAARLSTEFETCVVGGAVDLAALALRDKTEDRAKELHKAARHNRQLACVHELKAALKNAFGDARYCERSGDNENPGGARGPEKEGGSDDPGAVAVAAE